MRLDLQLSLPVSGAGLRVGDSSLKRQSRIDANAAPAGAPRGDRDFLVQVPAVCDAASPLPPAS